jgi:hypothetical protein
MTGEDKMSRGRARFRAGSWSHLAGFCFDELRHRPLATPTSVRAKSHDFRIEGMYLEINRRYPADPLADCDRDQ